MRILCTGGAGYVGSACVRWLLEHGHDPFAFDDLSEGNAAALPRERLIVGDIADRDALASAMRRHAVEAVMHFAALASVPDSIAQPDRYYRTNVVGTMNVLDAMRDAGVMVILASSTAAVYAFDQAMPLTEESTLRPEVPYGTTKLAAERMISDYARAYGMGYCLLRYFNASGADTGGAHGECRSSESHLIPLALEATLGRREKFMVFGGDWETRDGTCVRDYIHIEDLAHAHQLCVEALDPGMGRVYNLGTGTGITVHEVLSACETVAGRPVPHEVVDRRPGDPAVLIASSERIQRELGWRPRYRDIREIVETAWRWHSTHPEGYGPR